LASGPPIGQGYRWRYQLMVAEFGLAGELELAVVRTPHIGGVVEFYRLNGDTLEIVAQISGFSTHTIGSRNLENALAGDFNGDGQIELVLPDQSHTNLIALQRSANGVAPVWNVPMGAVHTSNLASVNLPTGGIAIGVGIEHKMLRIWHP